MKKRIISLFAAAALLMALLAACGGDTNKGNGDNKNDGKTYELSFTIHDPATSAKTHKYEELAAAVKDATNGAVNITVYPGATLVAAGDVAEGVLSGAADMGWLFIPFFPDQFPLTEALSLPLVFDDSITGTKVLLELYEQVPELQAELSKYKVLNMYLNPVNYIYSNTPVHTASDVASLQLRATAGTVTNMIQAWGGTPITMGPGDMYNAIEKKTLDGAIFEWSGFDDFSLYEVVDYVTEVPVCSGIFLAVMNLDKYNSLPAEYQETLDEIWGDPQVSIDFAQIYMDDFPEAYQHAEENGMTVITPTADEIATFQVAADNYIQQWITKNTSADFDAQAYYDLMLSIRDQIVG